MGQKVNPIGMRLGIIRDHDSVWYAERGQYRQQLINDTRLRAYLRKQLSRASLGRIVIERMTGSAKVVIHTARPGVVIGKKGEDIDKLRVELGRPEYMDTDKLSVDIHEIKQPDLNAQLVASNVARQLESRIMFRRAIKKTVQNTMSQGAEGVRVQVSGRLGGADIARTEWVREGRVPLHTLRADIDYATATAMTTYGIIGVKVWIFKGEILDREPEPAEPAAETQ